MITEIKRNLLLNFKYHDLYKWSRFSWGYLNDKILYLHEDVIKWKKIRRYWPLVRGIHRSPVNSPHKGQGRGALMFSLICVWISDWINNRKAGDLWCYRAHYDVIVMWVTHSCHFVLALKLLSGDQSWILRDAMCRKFAQAHNVMMDTLEIVGNFRWNIKKMIYSYRSYCVSLISDIAFLSITVHMRLALMSQYLFVVGTEPFPTDRNVKYDCFHCAF